MTTGNKVTKIYCFADDVCKYFSTVIKNRQIDSDSSVRRNNRESTVSDVAVTIFGAYDYVVQMLWNYTYLNVGQVIKLSGKSIVPQEKIWSHKKKQLRFTRNCLFLPLKTWLQYFINEVPIVYHLF